MAEEQDLSPWAHPKAKAWFRELFNRTQFGFMLEDVVKLPDEQLPHDLMRTILAFAILLGREETWPEEHRSVLNLILDRARRSTTQKSSPAGQKMTLSEHREQGRSSAELTEELEILRRRLGRSFRKSKLETPKTWRPFWT